MSETLKELSEWLDSGRGGWCERPDAAVAALRRAIKTQDALREFCAWLEDSGYSEAIIEFYRRFPGVIPKRPIATENS